MNIYDIIIKNGVYIMFGCMYYSFYDIKLALYVYLKTFSANYYYHFNYLYPQPNLYKWKHFIRLTDTGHYANFLFYFYPSTLPICHNIHFIICFGYYITKIFFGLKNKDDKDYPSIINGLQVLHCEINHLVPYLVLLYNNVCNLHDFNNYTLMYSYLWIYCWLILIYVPWRYYTGDSVYSILDNSVSWKIKTTIFSLFNGIIYIANQIGYYSSGKLINNEIR